MSAWKPLVIVRSWKLKWLLILLFGVFIALRLYYWQFVTPQTLNQDEAAILVNARMLQQFGHDEWNQKLPLVYKSFGDSKLPGYLYSVLPVTYLFSPEHIEFVRLPSLVVGFFLPVVVFFFTRAVTRSSGAAWWASILLILSPWTWHYGTTAFEAHVALMLFVASLALIFRRRIEWTSDIVAAVCLLIASLTYNTPWLLLPFIVVAVGVWRWPDRWSALRGMGVLTTVFLIAGALTFSATSQKTGISVFQDATVISEYPAFRQQFPGLMKTILGNKYAYFGQLVAKNWLSEWSWSFLVTKGGANPWHAIPGVGHVHMIVPVLFFFGLPFLLKKLWLKTEWRQAILVLWLLIISTAPAAITVDAPHATRSLFFFVMVTVVAGWQAAILTRIWLVRPANWPNRILGSIFILLLAWGLAWWWIPASARWSYLISPRWNADLWQVLRSEPVRLAETVYIEDPNGTLYVYAILADPELLSQFLSTVQRSSPDTVGLVRVERVGKYRFILDERGNIGGSGVLLKQHGNTNWDIIEL